MKIALVTDGIWPHVLGGMQKHSYFLAKYLAKRHVNVLLVHTAPAMSSSIDYLASFSEAEKSHITQVMVEMPVVAAFPGHYLLQSYRYSKACYDAIRSQFSTIDFIIAQGLTGWYFVNHKNGLPPIAAHCHGYEFMQWTPGLVSALQSKMLYWPFRSINRKADYVFSLGGKLNELITKLGVPANNIIQIPGGIEEDWSVNVLPEKDGLRRFIFVGRHERRKGIEELTEVLRNSKDRFEFHFVGPIPAELQLNDPRVTYHGAVMDKTGMQQLLQNAEVLVCPSYAEGMPTVILEGMANGCAVLATDVGAVSLLVDDSTGWLIPAADEKALSGAMSEILHMSNEALNLRRRNALARVKKDFLWNDIIDRTIGSIQARIKS